jgi:beta-aspartyl-peptidase (threonine type)
MSYRITQPMADFVNKAMLGEELMLACRDGEPVTYIKNSRYNIEKVVIYQIGQLLENGVKGTDVVVEVIKILEDSPLFNAGRGSVFSNSGNNEMDAAIMDGQNLKCGAVTNLTSIKNPIELAHCIMQKSKFIFLNGQGAEQFAKENNIKIVDPKYFFDKKRPTYNDLNTTFLALK